MNYIIYHRADFDGYFSALVTAAYIEKTEKSRKEIYFIGYNYEDKIMKSKSEEFRAENVTNNDTVYFVDCFKRDEKFLNALLKNAKKVVIIDHHATTDDFFYDYFCGKEEEKTKNLALFIRNSSIKDNGKVRYPYSAAELCFLYFFGNKDLEKCNTVPKLIRLISKYDIWYKEDEKRWKNEILPFQFGLRSFGGIITANINGSEATDAILTWMTLYFSENTNVVKADATCPIPIELLTSQGEAILSYIKQRNKCIASFGKKCTLIIEGDNERPLIFDECFFATDYSNNSMLFEDGLPGYEDYEYLIILGPKMEEANTNYNGIKCNVQIISANPESDCSQLCKALGGGGHKGIGGCTAYASIRPDRDEEEDLKILTLSKIKNV